PPATHASSPLSLHDALPISGPPARHVAEHDAVAAQAGTPALRGGAAHLSDLVGTSRWRHAQIVFEAAPGLGEVCEQAREIRGVRSEEHTSELQSRENLVCRL